MYIYIPHSHDHDPYQHPRSRNIIHVYMTWQTESQLKAVLVLIMKPFKFLICTPAQLVDMVWEHIPVYIYIYIKVLHMHMLVPLYCTHIQPGGINLCIPNYLARHGVLLSRIKPVKHAEFSLIPISFFFFLIWPFRHIYISIYTPPVPTMCL